MARSSAIDKKMSPDALNATIERSEFDAVMQKLLKSGKPISKDRISARSKLRGFGSSVSRAAKPKGQQ